MTYLEFLTRWYNLVFLALVVGGAGGLLLRRLSGSTGFRKALTLLVAGIAGLTLNGALHDLGLGPPGPRFPLVLAAAGLIGWIAGGWITRFRNRHLRPITAVRFNRPGHEGTVARLVSRDTGPAPGSGRAQWQDDEGVLHIVHVHTQGEALGFGRRVVLDAFDSTTLSYGVRALPSRRGKSPSRNE